MKKKLLSFVLAICCLIPCAFALTGCGNNPDKDEESTPVWENVFNYQFTGNNNIKLISIKEYGNGFKKLNIPETIDGYTVTEIGKDLFKDNTTCEEVTFPKTVTKINVSPYTTLTENSTIYYNNSGSVGLYFGDHTVSLNLDGSEKTITPSKLKQINVDSENEYYKSIDGVLFNKQGTYLLNYPIGRTETEYTVPEGTIIINKSAFYKSNLEKITLPNSLKQIEPNAFEWCSKLKEVVYTNKDESKLQIICDEAFKKCTSLTSFVMPSKVVYIGYKVFDQDSQLATIEFERKTGWIQESNERYNMNVTDSTNNVTTLKGTYSRHTIFFNNELLVNPAA